MAGGVAGGEVDDSDMVPMIAYLRCVGQDCVYARTALLGLDVRVIELMRVRKKRAPEGAR